MNHRASRRPKSHEWIHRVDGRPCDDVVASRGTIVHAGRAIDYYTTQPSVGQWIALGVVPLLPGVSGYDGTHRVVVGTGSTEETAVESLRERATPILSASMPVPIADPFVPASEPSDWFG